MPNLTPVRIAQGPPQGLPLAGTLVGTELIPMDQATGVTANPWLTVKASLATIAAYVASSGSFISSVVGTANEIAVSTTAGVATLSFSPNIIIPAPASGTALTINGVAGNIATWGIASHTGLLYASTGGIQIGSYTNDSFGIFVNNGSPAINIATTGAVNIAAPTSTASALTVNGVAGAFAQIIIGSSTSTASDGLFISAGTTSADAAIAIYNRAQTTGFMEIFGDGHGYLGANSSSGVQWNAAGAVSIAANTGYSLTVTGVSGYNVAVLNSGTTVGSAYGPLIRGGSNSSDVAIQIQNYNATINFFTIYGDGGVVVGSPTGGDQGAGTINTPGLYINGSPLYVGSPVNTQTTSYTLVLADQNKTIVGNAGSAITLTIPANSSVAFPVGTMVTFYNFGSVALTIPITTDTMYLAPGGTTGTRTLAAKGVATATKIASTVWFISGAGLT
jgi:hypothetical protein